MLRSIWFGRFHLVRLDSVRCILFVIVDVSDEFEKLNGIDASNSGDWMHIESGQRLYILFVHLSVSIIISNWIRVELDRLKYQNARNHYHANHSNECWNKAKHLMKTVRDSEHSGANVVKWMNTALYLHLHLQSCARLDDKSKLAVLLHIRFKHSRLLPVRLTHSFWISPNEFVTLTYNSISEQTDMDANENWTKKDSIQIESCIE